MSYKDLDSVFKPFMGGHKFLSRGILLFGTCAVTLAGLIFVFPAFIGALVATFTLLAGLLALVAGYRIWKLGDRTNEDSHPVGPDYETVCFHSPGYRYRSIRFVIW